MNETRSFLLRLEQYIDSSYQSFASHNALVYGRVSRLIGWQWKLLTFD